MEEKGVEESNMNKEQQRHEPRPCPRCMSLNTKFCYYNNHSVRQPRYFCKDCRRNWTHGGALRDIPVGGRSHKQKNAEFASTCWPQQPPQQPPLPPPQPPSNGVLLQPQFYQMGGRETEVQSLHSAASHSDYSQNYFNNNANNMNHDSSQGSGVISSNTERQAFATDSSALNPNQSPDFLSYAHPRSHYH